jgi:hypothetical protein
MHEAAFAAAALPTPTVVLGLLLRPYSLGHELFLIRENNPAVLPGVDAIKPKDLTQAALICCQSFAECEAMKRDWLLGFKLWIWEKRVERNSGPGRFEKERQAFVEYRQSGCLEFPESNIEETESGRTPGAPFILRLHHFVMSLGKSEAAAWDYPFGLSKMRQQAFYESEGRYKIYNSHDAGFDRYVEEQEREEFNRSKQREQRGTNG